MKGAGSTLSFRQTARAMGAMPRTVATFSTNIERIPVMTRRITIAMPRVGALATALSASTAGARE